MNKKGFTLVELLATIIVLGILIGIVIYVTTSVISRSKEKSYQVTIHEIESNTSNYLAENANRLFYLENTEKGYEYQCVTVENLVDYGYLTNDVTNSNISSNSKAELGDYIYIERDIYTKAVTKTLYTKTNPEYIDTCAKAINALGDITFTSSPSFNEWSKYKDVTITYRLKNLNDQRTLNDYKFNHSYSGQSTHDSTNDTLENNTKTKLVRVTSNGDLSANIMLDNESITSNKKKIDKIDIVGPVISLDSSSEKKVHNKAILPLKVTDFGIGVDYSSFTTEDIIVKVGDTKIDNIKLEHDSDEKYNLTIINNTIVGNIKISIAKDKVFDKLENGNLDIEIDTGIMFENIYKITYDANGGGGAPSPTTYTSASSGTVKLSETRPARTDYIFTGWSTDKDASDATYDCGGEYPRNNANNVTLYAVWIYGVWEYEYSGTIEYLKIPYDGYYSLEVWGGQGGGITIREGGLGGYSKGKVMLQKEQELYIVVGGVGSSVDQRISTGVSGGYNGGGSGGNGYGGYAGGTGGGGATHIAFESGLLSTLSNKTNKVLIVAGGGGGTFTGGSGCYNTLAGSGGGYKGNTGRNIYSELDGIGGTQNSGFSFGEGSHGSNGTAVISCGAEGRAGGGGGYYGGYSPTGSGGSGSGGGSGYIGNPLLKNKAMYCYNCEESNNENTKTISTDEKGIHEKNKTNIGNGYAKISFDGYA